MALDYQQQQRQQMARIIATASIRVALTVKHCEYKASEATAEEEEEEEEEGQAVAICSRRTLPLVHHHHHQCC